MKGLRADRRSGPEDRRSSEVEGRGATRLVARDRVYGCSLFTCDKLSKVGQSIIRDRAIGPIHVKEEEEEDLLLAVNSSN